MTDTFQTEAPRPAVKADKPILRAPKPTAQAAAPAPKAKSVRFPAKLNISVSLEVAESLKRLSTHPGSLKREVDLVREALQIYLAHQDPVFRSQVMGGPNGS